MKVKKVSTLRFTLRFANDKQRAYAEKIAKKNKRSLNSEILHMVDIKILNEKSKGVASND